MDASLCSIYSGNLYVALFYEQKTYVIVVCKDVFVFFLKKLMFVNICNHFQLDILKAFTKPLVIQVHLIILFHCYLAL